MTMNLYLIISYLEQIHHLLAEHWIVPGQEHRGSIHREMRGVRKWIL